MFTSLFARAREVRAAELEGEGGLEAGFTLIELMVVLLIIAILLAIAIPTFLGVSGSAKDRAAQSNLTTALTDTIAYYQNTQNYDASSSQSLLVDNDLNTGCSQYNSEHATCSGTSPAVNLTTASQLQTQEPSYTWENNGTACTSSIANCVSVAPVDVANNDDGQGVILAVFSANSNTCWYVMNLQGTPTAGLTDFATNDSFNANGASLPTDVAGGTVNAAGTYYAKLKNQANCSATTAATGTWGPSYSNPGAA